MKALPGIDDVRRIAAGGKYKVLPVSSEILSDFITPIETMRILKNVSTHCYMLESAQANETWGRYTFLGYDLKLEISCMDGVMKIGNATVKTDDPSNYLRQILADYKSPPLIIFLLLRADLWATSLMIILHIANQLSDVMWKTARILRMQT